MEYIRDSNGEVKERFFMAGNEYRLNVDASKLNTWDRIENVDY